MPDPIKAMEIMNQLNLEYGNEPPAKSRSKDNDKKSNPDKAERFRQSMEDATTEREAQKNLRKIETNKAKFEVGKMAEQHNAEKTSANEYRKYPASTRPAGGGGAGAGGDLEKGMMGSRLKPLNKAKGGTIKSASSRADGIAIRGKTRA